MKQETKDKLLAIIFFIIVFFIILSLLIFIINKISHFNQCKDNPDTYIAYLGDKSITCGELRAINTSLVCYHNPYKGGLT